MYNVVDIVLLLAFVQTFFSAAGISLCTFNRRFEGFVTFMLGIGLIIPIVYITVLAVYKILPKSWIAYIKKWALHLPCTNRACLHIEEDAEDPLLSYLEESVEYEVTFNIHFYCTEICHITMVCSTIILVVYSNSYCKFMKLQYINYHEVINNSCFVHITKDGTDNDYIINGVLSIFFLYPQKQLSADATT